MFFMTGLYSGGMDFTKIRYTGMLSVAVIPVPGWTDFPEPFPASASLGEVRIGIWHWKHCFGTVSPESPWNDALLPFQVQHLRMILSKLQGWEIEQSEENVTVRVCLSFPTNPRMRCVCFAPVELLFCLRDAAIYWAVYYGREICAPGNLVKVGESSAEWWWPMWKCSTALNTYAHLGCNFPTVFFSWICRFFCLREDMKGICFGNNFCMGGMVEVY